MKKLFCIFLISVLFITPFHAETKRSDLAGSWYPASKERLEALLRSYLEGATPPPIEGKIISLILPHAGFIYSGPVAAYGFKVVQGQDIETVVVVGFSHRRYYDAIAVLDMDGFETPLGVVEIDREITQRLAKESPKIYPVQSQKPRPSGRGLNGVYNYPEAFSEENSVEMEIPFLQMALKDFKIVLLAIGEQNFANCRILGEALYEVLKDKENFLLVASTDMSHYLPYKEANELDRKTISVIKGFDAENLYAESLSQGHRLMCGYGAVCATMLASKKLGADRVEILKYANSGDTMGDRSRVVGYLSAALVKSQITNSPAFGGIPQKFVRRNFIRDKLQTNSKSKNPNSKKGDRDMLSEEQKEKMLKLARDSIMHYLKNGEHLEVKEEDPVLNKEMGAFVTLHKHGQLRGCIGNLIGQGPFYLTVRDMAVEAATGDPRFPNVALDEMGDIDIEISALSPLEKINDPNKIVMGKHGVLVRKGAISGVYLPQVATETGWSREEFMNSLCGHKAGMEPDAWRKGKCDIYIFTAEVFGEKD